MAWGSAHKTNLRKVHLKEKNAIRLICNENKLAHTKLLTRSLQILTIKTKHSKSLCVHVSCQNLW